MKDCGVESCIRRLSVTDEFIDEVQRRKAEQGGCQCVEGGEPPLTTWGYCPASDGPAHWHRLFPVAKAGRRQSPIDICPSADWCQEGCGGQVEPALIRKWAAQSELRLENTGASWMVSYPESSGCSVSGGPLQEGAQYKLLQMHAHWGAENGRGSEHTVEGRGYEGELHLVFYNNKYTPQEAMDKDDGLAVVGVFLQAGEEHKELKKVTDQLEKVKAKGEATVITEELNPGLLVPPGPAYFTYPGSLTAPPLFESVTWLLFSEPVQLSNEQLEKMRQMTTPAGTGPHVVPLQDNYRPVCCRAERQVRNLTASS